MDRAIIDTILIICKDDKSIQEILYEIRGQCVISKIAKDEYDWLIATSHEWIWLAKPDSIYSNHFHFHRFKLCFIQDDCYSKELENACLPLMENIMYSKLGVWIKPQIFMLYKG